MYFWVLWASKSKEAWGLQFERNPSALLGHLEGSPTLAFVAMLVSCDRNLNYNLLIGPFKWSEPYYWGVGTQVALSTYEIGNSSIQVGLVMLPPVRTCQVAPSHPPSFLAF